MTAVLAPVASTPSVGVLASSFARSLKAQNKSPRTVVGYLEGVHLFAAFLEERHLPTGVAALSREHVEMFPPAVNAPVVEGVHPHRFRHTFAHLWLSSGGQETDLMRLAGWKSRATLSKYGASAGAERAREAHANLRIGDRI